MGLYINPPDKTKEEWLRENGTLLTKPPCWFECQKDENLPVVLVQNTCFTAAAVAYSPEELKTFSRSDDFRPKRYYSAPIEKLK